MTLPIHFSPEYVLAHGPQTTVTKSGRIADAAVAEFGDRVRIIAPELATADELRTIHDVAYVEAVLTGEPFDLACGGLGEWSPALSVSVLASTGGVRDAVLLALATNGVAGSLSSGLHHAHVGYGTGYCTLNGLALGALAALDAGATTVGILDVDAHCGGGTFEILKYDARVRIADVSTSAFDSWTPFTDRHHLEITRDADAYLDRVAVALEHLEGVDLLIHNAGMDPVEGGAAGATSGFTPALLAARERLIADWIIEHSVPAAFALAGGYVGSGVSIDDVVDLHLHTVREFERVARHISSECVR